MKKVLFPILALVLALSLGTTGAFAAVSSTQDGGVCGPDISPYPTRVYIIDNLATKIDANPVIVTAPTDVKLHMYESDIETRVFNEKQNVSVTGLVYDGGTYTGNVDSHLIHQEPTMGEPGTPTDPITDAMRGRGCISFATNIIGVITSDSLLDASDSVLGLATTTTYPAGQVNRGLEMGSGRSYQDIIEIDGKVLRIDLQSAEVMDQIRVLTEPVNPEITIDKEAGVDEACEGDTITYTYTVENTGNVPLDNVTVTDPDVDDPPGITGPVEISGNADASFDPGEIWEFTGQYTVPWFTDGTVDNTGTANADYDGEPITPAEDGESVSILHNPDIEVTKSGPEDGYFESCNAEYEYEVENTGDCAIEVVVTDDMIGEVGKIDGGEYLIPRGTKTFTASNLLECDGITLDKFVNVATAEGTDATGGKAYSQDCWTVILFQWQPRTIGYWGNWENHYSDDDFGELFDCVEDNWDYFDGKTKDDVHDFLLSSPPKGKMCVDKARLLAGKQLLAAMLNVCAYEAWVDGAPWGSADVGMDPDAMVYPCGLTVEEVINHAAGGLVGMGPKDISHVLDGKDLLDKMNNAKDGYEAFVDRTHLACAFLYPVSSGSSNNVLTGEPSQGCVVIFDDPTGEVAIEIDGNAHGLTPDHEYSIWVRDLSGYTGFSYNSAPSLGYYLLDYFTTDGDGMGFFELNIDSADLSDGTYNIQVAINDPSVEPPYTTIIATVKYTSVTVG